MNYDLIIEHLRNRNKEQEENPQWQSSVALTEQILEKIENLKVLDAEIASTRQVCDVTSKTFDENTELGAIVKEKLEVNTGIRELNCQINNSILKKEQLRGEIKSLRKEKKREKACKIEIRTQKNNMKTKKIETKKQYKRLYKKLNALRSQSEEVYLEYSSLQQELQHFKAQSERLETIAQELSKYPIVEIANPVDTSQCVAPIPTSTRFSSFEDSDMNEPIHATQLKSIENQIELTAHKQPITCLAFAHTEPMLITGSEEKTFCVYNAASMGMINNISDSSKSILALEFSPSDSTFLAASYDSSVRFYSTNDLRRVATCTAHKDKVLGARYADESRVLSCGADLNIFFYDINRNVTISQCKTSSTPYSIYPLIGESLVVTSHHDGKLRSWDFRTANDRPIIEMDAHGYGSKAIQVLGINSSHQTISISHDDKLTLCDFMGMGKAVITKTINKLGALSDRTQMAIRQDSVLVGGNNGVIYEFDLKTLSLQTSKEAHESPVICICSRNRSNTIASGDYNGCVKIWRV